MNSRRYRLATPSVSNIPGGSNVMVKYCPSLSKTSSIQCRSPLTTDDVTKNRKKLLPNAKLLKRTFSSVLPPRWWLALPCLVFMTLATSSTSLLKNDLLVHRACRLSSATTPTNYYWLDSQYNPQLPQSSYQSPPQQNSDYNLVQSAVAQFNTKNSLVTFIPSLISFVLLGASCDTMGRRPMLLLPFLGKIVESTLMLVVVTRNLSDAWILAAHGLEAMFDSAGLIMLSGFAYITVCSPEEKRTRAFLLAELVLIVARIGPTLALGLWLNKYSYSYVVPISISLGLSVIGQLYALFIQPESVQSVSVGYSSVLTLYLYGRPFYMSAFQVALLSTAISVTIAVLTLTATLSKRRLDSSYLLPVIGVVMSIVHHVIFAVAKTVWLLYLGACIGSLSFISMPTLRTKLTKAIEPNEYAIVFIAAGIVDTIGREGVSAGANAIYKASLNFFPGLVFLVFSIFALVTIFIMRFIWPGLNGRNTWINMSNRLPRRQMKQTDD
ncbi:unnamed protein product [Rotaria socialis]|uniref:Uncharacterized protein n=1 Tax=Rotaria socialis TaxID=392032 RepID=A0A821A3Q6_9BILA|nr:unnamed protein product [Rotaria socialis]CAF4572428.1 unnamed protein product [Rotaria socialis]